MHLHDDYNSTSISFDFFLDSSPDCFFQHRVIDASTNRFFINNSSTKSVFQHNNIKHSSSHRLKF
ncbi:unnamed protein product [Oikopleura dioica]|uniref:Uncharacterized protein n=1 Tax=Oikopleura dioica TaxID=34765 RepID=E4X8M8_OIKDI|nr:unnamed protein product [Oikopleura dioica]